MNQKNVISLPKKSKDQIEYEKITTITRNILEPFDIDYDVVEVVHQYKGIYSIKVFIEKSGTHIVDCDKKGYKEFLKDVRKKIQDNPSLCPFCKEPNPTDKCKMCHATFIDSKSHSGSENFIINYGGFSEFSKFIEKNTFLSDEVIRNYIRLHGDLKEIVNGVDVVFQFDSSFPTFCIGKEVSIKDFEEIDQHFLNILIISFIVSNNEKYSVFNTAENYREEEFAFRFKDKNTNLNVILFFENEYSGYDNYISSFKMGIENDTQTYLNLFLPEKNIDLSKDFEKEEEIYEELYVSMMDLNYFSDTKGYDYYFVFDVGNIEDLNLSDKKGIKEISNLYLKHIDNCIEKALSNIKNNLREIV